MYQHFFKRIIDFVGAAIGLLLCLPIMLWVGFLLYKANQESPFFFQNRPGKNNRIFLLVKFKTMNDARDAQGQLLPDAQRLTKVGKWVRSTSLDELPQLYNVLKGDMSLIGPRPLLVKYLDRYTQEQARRHEVRPGLTGWAQINGRNALSWEQKFAYDLYYVKYYSFLLDMKILFLTIKKVVKKEDISNQASVTMPEFMGTQANRHSQS